MRRSSEKGIYLSRAAKGLLVFEVIMILWCLAVLIYDAWRTNWVEVLLFIALGSWNAYSLIGTLRWNKVARANYFTGIERKRVVWT